MNLPKVMKAKIEVPVMATGHKKRIERREISLRVIAVAEGWAMVRKPGQVPFVIKQSELYE